MRLSLSVSLGCALAGALPAAATTLLPDFSAAVFEPGAPIDNPYFPLRPGYAATISGNGIDDEGEAFTEASELSYAGSGPVILGVRTTAMQDLAYEDDLLVEATRDYYAQDAGGNVWYFGEDVTNYVYDDEDRLVSTNADSAWIAGENGALPGYIMPSFPEEGFSYYQEFAAADEALDEATIWATGQTVAAGGATYSDVLVTFETTALDPEAREFKYYAPGIGLIRADEGLDATLTNPELVLALQPTPAPVPLPPALPLLAAGLAMLAALGRPRGGPAGSPIWPGARRPGFRCSVPAPG